MSRRGASQPADPDHVHGSPQGPRWARCAGCDTGRLVQITMKVEERELVMSSCPECGTRWSGPDGRTLSLDGVLDLASLVKR